MIAYEFYSVDKKGETHFLGILPERRKNPGRITEKSVMKWGKMILGDNRNSQNLYFIKVVAPDTSKNIKKHP